ncbi:MAG TPA: hypothetical protein VHW23_13295 [Kofleriaceae bacterium]|jgi:hypothetical protein|nr:hypothetical protein [Kofleriaceae bacterium]
MGFIHRCALGYFAPDSLLLVEGVRLRVERPLPREVIEPLRSHIVPIKGRPDAWWEGDLLIVEYIVSYTRKDRMEFIREVVRATGCSVVDVNDRKPWPIDVIEGLGSKW